MLDSARVNTLTETLTRALLQSSTCLENHCTGTTSPARRPAECDACLQASRRKGTLSYNFLLSAEDEVHLFDSRWHKTISGLVFSLLHRDRAQLEAGGFRVSTAWWIPPPPSSLTVRFRSVELEAQLLNQSNAYLHNIYLLFIYTHHIFFDLNFFNPAVVLSVCPFKASIYIKLHGL